jgi:pyruvate dehydrogenase E2 component (dihydrolipoyllysine-residue acetyltransferase)
MHKVVMPRIDPGMQTGYIVQWLKEEGDQVAKGEPVAIGEGEKTTFDIVAPESGILRKQLYPVKSEVQVTEIIALVGGAEEEIPLQSSRVLAEESKAAPTPASGEVVSTNTLQRISPAARRLAREKNIDLSEVKGTGPGGRITQEDVLKVAPQTTTNPPNLSVKQNLPRVDYETRLSPTRKTIADRLSYSQRSVASAVIMMDVAMDALLTLKQQHDATNSQVSLTAIIVKALAKALSEDRTFNSSLEDELIRTYADTNIAVAIEGPDGLVAPVVPYADEKTLEEITSEIGRLTEKANSHKLSLNELTGSTATISNLGPQGVESFIPIINPPNAITLGVGSIKKRTTAIDDKILTSSTSTFTLVFDHRIADGVAAAKLLARLKQLLENPETLARQTA